MKVDKKLLEKINDVAGRNINATDLDDMVEVLDSNIADLLLYKIIINSYIQLDDLGNFIEYLQRIMYECSNQEDIDEMKRDIKLKEKEEIDIEEYIKLLLQKIK